MTYTVLTAAVVSAVLVSIPGVYSMLTAPESLKDFCDKRGYRCVIDDMNKIIMVLTPGNPERAMKLCFNRLERQGFRQDWKLSVESTQPGYDHIVCKF